MEPRLDPGEPPRWQRRVLFPVLTAMLVLAAIEAMSYAAWRLKDGPAKLSLYAELVRTAYSYRFWDPPGVFLPVPGVEMVRYKTCYVDRFKTRDVLGRGFGLYDDGIDPRPVRAVALGDSFTAGVGSLDTLKNGWVELVEKRLDWLDLVNVSLPGTGTLQQTRFYGRIAPFIRHDLVVLGFYAGNDFTDNAMPFDWNRALADLPGGEDPTKVFIDIQYALNFQWGQDFLMHSPVRSYAAWACLRLAQRLARSELLPRRIRLLKDRYQRMRDEARDPRVPAAVAALGTSNWVGCRRVPRGAGRRVEADVCPYDTDARQAEVLAGHSAGLINAFHADLERQGKRLILVVHPTMWRVYLSKADEAGLGADFGRPTALLKAKLARGIPVLDLYEPMRRAAEQGSTPIYWLEDDHYSPAGYALAAEETAAFLSKTIPHDKRR